MGNIDIIEPLHILDSKSNARVYGGHLGVIENGILVSRGLVPGQSIIHKFGETGALSKDVRSDLWSYSATEEIYTYSTTADIDSVSSSNAGDNQEVLVSGLDANWLEVNQTVSLAGTSSVSLGTPLLRVYRVKNQGSTDFAGNVYVYPTTPISGGVPSDTTKVRAYINSSDNQTLMALMPVPAGKKAYLKKWFCTLSGNVAGFINVHLLYRPFGGVFQLKESISITSNGNSVFQYDYHCPLEFESKGDFKIDCDASVVNMICGAGFDLTLIDD